MRHQKIVVLLLLILVVLACQKASLYFDLEVLSGSGTGRYPMGSEVAISARAADTGMRFSHWTGDTAYLEDPSAPATLCQMPRADVQVKAVYTEAPYFALEIVSGLGSGLYQEGSLVAIRAKEAGGDTAFFQWVGDTEYVNQVKAPRAEVQMPARPIRLRAEYRALPTYALEVIDGLGSGQYLAGTLVPISPILPTGLYFKEWTGDIEHLDDPLKEEAVLTMPSESLRIQAQFESAISFNSQVLPLMLSYCATSGCHDQNGPNEPLTNYAEVKAWASDIRDRVRYDNMPPVQPLSPSNKQIIIKWVDQGAQNN